MTLRTGQQTVLGDIINTGKSVGGFSRKNLLINPHLIIGQRLAFPAATAANGLYVWDRWRYLKSGDMVHTISQSSDCPTSAQTGGYAANSGSIDVTTADASMAAGDYCYLMTYVEGYDYRRLSGQYGTLSFWIKSHKTGIFCVSFLNNASNYSYIAEYTVNVADTWEKKTITVLFNSAGTWEYDTDVGVRIRFCLACGSTNQGTANVWANADKLATANQVNGTDSTDNITYITQLQLELGQQATDFEWRDFGAEVVLCQRYFEKSYNLDVTPGTSGAVGGLYYCNYTDETSGEKAYNTNFRTSKRGIPAITTYDNVGASAKISTFDKAGATTTGQSYTALYCIGFNGFAMYITGSTVSGVAFSWTADCEY